MRQNAASGLLELAALTVAGPALTLLVCTSNRPKLLHRLLETVSRGTVMPDQVVIVNGVDGQTPRIVKKSVHCFPEVLLIQHPNRNLATLRNLGLPHCTGDIVAMTDDDAIPNPEWVEALHRSHGTHPEAGGIGGPVTGATDTLLSRVADLVVFPSPRPGQKMFTLPTVNMSYRRAVMQRVGVFDEALFRGEDVDYNWRVVEAGSSIVFDSTIRVRHEHRDTLRGLYHQQYMYGRAYVLVRSKWPQMYTVYPHSLGTIRAWAKLVHAGLAIMYQPFLMARAMPSPGDRIPAFGILVGHHLIWKAGMARQAWLCRSGRQATPRPRQAPIITRWIDGEPTDR